MEINFKICGKNNLHSIIFLYLSHIVGIKVNSSQVKVGVIIPDRNDRPRLLENCKRMIEAQTLRPHTVNIVNYEPLSNECDITQRYRTGYNQLRNKGLDLIAFMENDDWYSSEYLEYMANKWLQHGHPKMIGTDYTIYYHLKLFSHLTMYHANRSSMMSTLMKPDLEFPWCRDIEPYTDIHVWNVVQGVIFKPEKHICLGIKHGEGMCGGVGHVNKLNAFVNRDPNKTFLREIMDQESFEFYSTYFQNEL